MPLPSTIRPVLTILLLLLSLALAGLAHAQTVPAVSAPPAAGAAKAEQDPFGRETPQGMLSGLMNALASADYKRALTYFETDSVPGISNWYRLSGDDLARRFQEVLDRAGRVVTAAELSNSPAGNVNDGLPADIERFGTIKGPQGEIPLLAHRVDRDGKSLWLVADETLQQVPALSRTLEVNAAFNSYFNWIPDGPTIAGAPAAHWVALVSAAFLSLVLAWLLTMLQKPIVRYVRRGGGENRLSRVMAASAGPLRILIALILFGIATQAMEVSIVARYRALFLAQIVLWFVVVWLLWRWADAGSEVILGRMSERGQLTAYSAVSFLNRAIKVLLIFLFVAALLRAFGVDLTAGLAALGVGGLAIALGAQKLFENLIGSLTLIADRPVRIGDFCRFGSTLGTVEEIGIRSTRIRTLDRTLLTVPNGEFSALHIENYSQRDRFWFHPTLNLRYETTPEQMRNVLERLRALLEGHPKVERASARVRFVNLGAYSLGVEIFSYVYALDFNDFLRIQEELLLRCMEIVLDCGTGFAFPSQTLYLGKDAAPKES